MNPAWIIPFVLWIGAPQVPASPSEVVLSKSKPATRRQRLEAALQQFEEAVSLQSHASPQAQKLYQQARDGFEALIRDGVNNGQLYYNIANTYMRLGDIGRAIANYRRAQRLLPGDSNVRRNLEFARSVCEIQIKPTARSAIFETIFFWYFETSPQVRKQVAITAWLLFWGMLGCRLFWRRPRRVLGWSAAVAIVVAIAAGGSVAWDLQSSHLRKNGVIIADKATLRKGNGMGYQPQLDRALPEGVEFRVLESRPDVDANVWYHVQLRDGKDGWLRAEQATII